MSKQYPTKARDVTREFDEKYRRFGFPKFYASTTELDGVQKLEGTFVDINDESTVLTIKRSPERNIIRLINAVQHGNKTIKVCQYFQLDKKTPRKISHDKIATEKFEGEASILPTTEEFPSVAFEKLLDLDQNIGRLKAKETSINREFPESIVEAEDYVSRMAPIRESIAAPSADNPSSSDIKDFLELFKDQYLRGLGTNDLTESNRRNRKVIDGTEWIAGIDKQGNAFVSVFLKSAGNKTEIVTKINGDNAGFFVGKAATPTTHQDVKRIASSFGAEINFNKIKNIASAQLVPDLAPMYTTMPLPNLATVARQDSPPPPYTSSIAATNPATQGGTSNQRSS